MEKRPMDNVIETKGLTKRFKRDTVVNDVSLAIPKGSIFAFLGPNGAGKTTLIKMLMNIIRPNRGAAMVLGVHSQNLQAQQFAQIGYVSENQELPLWMTVRQFLAYCKPFYPTWDPTFCQNLMKQFSLPDKTKIKNLSRGMKMKLSLISSIAYRPKLLVLDEPFSGLDPLVREDLIDGVLDLTENEDWSIFLSSHDIGEVERLADSVGIINQGKLVISEETEGLQQRFRRVELLLEQPFPHKPSVQDGWYALQSQDRRVRFVESAFDTETSEGKYCKLFPTCKDIKTTRISLKEIFITIAKHHHIKGLEEESNA